MKRILIILTAFAFAVGCCGPTFAGGKKNLVRKGHGERLEQNATTDVWSLGNFAYTGTFNSPCGGDPDAGVWVWDVHNKNKPSFVGVIESPAGSQSNDVKAATMNSGDILVHSNESCGGGPGGFEIYNVDDPTSPVFKASVRIDELNPVSDSLFGGISDVGVHNLFLFNQGSSDYVGVVSEGAFDNFRIYDITDPTNPALASGWGAEEIFDPGVGDETVDVGRVGNAALWLLDGFGASANRFLHDVTVSEDGTRAYLSNWDAGLVLLDISDPTDPQLVSVAIDPVGGSLDGEVNSHAAWPSEDGSIVVESEEDFSLVSTEFSITSGSDSGPYPSTEGIFTTPISSLPGSEMSGGTTYVGFACGAVTAGTEIALIQRGGCSFDVKAANVISAGYSGMVVFNDAARGDDMVTMGGDPRSIPGVFVGHSTGLLIAGVSDAGSLVVNAPGESVNAASVANGWGGLRIWDYSDPANPVLASTFNTDCSLVSASSVDCDPAGTYTAHNVLVETKGNKVYAYVSWYSDGMFVLDVTDPYNPEQIARFFDNSDKFKASNGGNPHNFWGVYKEPNSPWILGSDKNGGLSIFKGLGKGTSKKKKKK